MTGFVLGFAIGVVITAAVCIIISLDDEDWS